MVAPALCNQYDAHYNRNSVYIVLSQKETEKIKVSPHNFDKGYRSLIYKFEHKQ